MMAERKQINQNKAFFRALKVEDDRLYLKQFKVAKMACHQAINGNIKYIPNYAKD